jgi:hypothetical protein
VIDGSTRKKPRKTAPPRILAAVFGTFAFVLAGCGASPNATGDGENPARGRETSALTVRVERQFDRAPEFDAGGIGGIANDGAVTSTGFVNQLVVTQSPTDSDINDLC